MEYEKIVDLCTKKYVSLETPFYFFVQRALKKPPYSVLMDKLRDSWIIKEHTEPNTDVSFRFELSDGISTFFLLLSMVGKFAIVLRHENGRNFLLNGQGETQTTQTEKNLLAIILDGGFTLLNEQTLKKPIEMTLVGVEPGEVLIYQALFADEVFPWVTN